MRLTSIALVMLALAFTAGCGSTGNSTSVSANGSTVHVKTVHFAKTRFLLHAGLAFGAFHRYVYKPFKAGSFAHPLQHKLALVKAGAAALFVVHEVRKARDAAQGSPALLKLFSPLDALAGTLTGVAAGLKSGHLDAPSIESAKSAVDSIKGDAASAGAAVTEHAPPVDP
ncbi:MAG TPA: hypothetical protein VLJ42_03720 [Solirubrobacteraceae bacterium]|nr:hypothetical protein [Solirubrobacteraceae bacterium]